MEFLKNLLDIPIDRLTRLVALGIIALAALEFLPWAQSVIEFLLNMEGNPK